MLELISKKNSSAFRALDFAKIKKAFTSQKISEIGDHLKNWRTIQICFCKCAGGHHLVSLTVQFIASVPGKPAVGPPSPGVGPGHGPLHTITTELEGKTHRFALPTDVIADHVSAFSFRRHCPCCCDAGRCGAGPAPLP